MASASSSLLTPSSAHFTGSKTVTDGSRLKPKCVRFRPLRISAACATTAERSTKPHIASPASLYEVLGIQTGATCQEIKSAYRRLARILHPDVAANSQRGNTAYEFIKVHEAYETLSDPERRAHYDRTLFIRRQPMGYPFDMSACADPVANSTVTGFSGYTRRTWETDQCW